MSARPQIIGHRGGKSFAPENTLAAFVACLEHGGDACELDVRMTSDEALVVLHDDTVDRVTGATGRVADLSVGQIAALRIGGEPVPTLWEVFDAARVRGGLQLHVKRERDEERNARLLEKVAAMVAEFGYEEHCTLLATHPSTLHVLRYNARLHFDLEIGPTPVAEAIAHYGREFLLRGGHRLKTSDFNLESEAMVREAHEAGLQLVCWARDSSDENVERLLRLGVDAVMTDYPERMGAIIDRVEPADDGEHENEGPS